MRSATDDLQQYLEALAREARPGDRLPTIRELMRRFGVSQMLVQRALQALKAHGLIDSQVGRGTYFRGAAVAPARAASGRATAERAAHAPASTVKSVLLLRRSISIARGRVLVEGLQRRLAADGHRVLELSYTDPDHALAVLKSLPRFDACMVQSTYRTIPIALLSALKEKSEVLAVDGAALVGADVEAVGTEWGEPLALAVGWLQQQGHRRIACATTTHPLLATQLGRRRFDALRRAAGGADLSEIALPLLPDEDYTGTLVQRIGAQLDAAGRPPFTALVAWGIEDGARLRELLAGVGLEVPGQLSVVLLGRTDLANEHAGFFHTIGCQVADQADALFQAIVTRWSSPERPQGVTFTPITVRPGNSVLPLPGATGRRPQR